MGVVGELIRVAASLGIPRVAVTGIEVVRMRIGHRGCDGLRLICSARMACCCPEIGSTGGSHRLAEQSAQTACTSDTGSIGCLDDEINAAGIERLRQLRPYR